MSKFIPFTDEELYQAHHKDIKEYLESIGEKVLHSGTEYMWETHDSVKYEVIFGTDILQVNRVRQ